MNFYSRSIPVLHYSIYSTLFTLILATTQLQFGTLQMGQRVEHRDFNIKSVIA